MGLFKDEGDPALALAEECAEVIQVIAKCNRFQAHWDELAPGDGWGDDVTRWRQLECEMEDLLYQWERLKASRR